MDFLPRYIDGAKNVYEEREKSYSSAAVLEHI